MAETKKFHAVHPGTILKEELEARGMSAAAFALLLRVAPQRIQEIVAGKRAIQQAYDLYKVEADLGAKVRAEVHTAA